MDGLENSKSIVDIANEEVSIYKVLSMVGTDAYGFYGNTSKIHCPFGAINHFDGGQERAMRVYEDTQSAYCFACSKYFNPVILWAEYNDLTLEEAAELLLGETGWKPETYESKWEKLTVKKDFDPKSIHVALDVFCSRLDPNWEINRIESPYLEVYSRLMDLIPRIKTKKEAERWLEVAKVHMRKVLTDE